MKQMIYKDEATYEISDSDLETLQDYIEKSNQNHKDRILKGFAEQLVKARSDYGLPPIPDNICNLKKGLDETLLYHPTSLCRDAQDGTDQDYLTTYSVIISRMLGDNSLFNRSSQVGLGKVTPGLLRDLLVAERLHLTVIPNVLSVTDIDSENVSFICLRCHPFDRRLRPWGGLVRRRQLGCRYSHQLCPQIHHFIQEMNDFDSKEMIRL